MEREVFRESGVDRGREGRKEREGGKKREGNGWEWGGGGGNKHPFKPKNFRFKIKSKIV